jgi:hypothetical protein
MFQNKLSPPPAGCSKTFVLYPIIERPFSWFESKNKTPCTNFERSQRTISSRVGSHWFCVLEAIFQSGMICIFLALGFMAYFLFRLYHFTEEGCVRRAKGATPEMGKQPSSSRHPSSSEIQYSKVLFNCFFFSRAPKM